MIAVRTIASAPHMNIANTAWRMTVALTTGGLYQSARP